MHESILDDLKINNYAKVFKNAIEKGMKNPEDWMYMYTAGNKDYFKNYWTRDYISYPCE